MEDEEVSSQTSNTQKPNTVSKQQIEDGKNNAILAYIGILIIVPLVDDKTKTNPYVKFHVNQGLVLLIAAVVYWPLSLVLAFIPILGWLASIVLGLGLFVLWLMGLLSALNGEMKRVPILGDYEVYK
jgi:uncharacterized membrane protein